MIGPARVPRSPTALMMTKSGSSIEITGTSLPRKKLLAIVFAAFSRKLVSA